MTRARGAAVAWYAYGAVAGVLTVVALFAWGRALVAAGPVLYGEGAVAHAALLARTFDLYRDAGGASFTAANYPPLYIVGASIGEPFITGRLLSIAATLSVAGTSPGAVAPVAAPSPRSSPSGGSHSRRSRSGDPR